MAKDDLDQVKLTLKDEEKRLRTELADARKRVKEIEADIARVRAGLAALSGKPSSSASKARAASASSRPAPVAAASTSGPPSPADLAELAADALIRHGTLSRERLEEEIASRLREHGLSCDRLREDLDLALRDSRFANGTAGWRLVDRTVRARGQEAVPAFG